MLNKAERFQFLKIFRFWCNLASLPVEVDLSTWEIRPHAKRQMTWKCHFWFFLFVLNTIYKVVTLVYLLKVGIELQEAILHAVLAACMSTYVYWYYVLYFKHPRLFGLYLKMTLTGNKFGYAAAVDNQIVRSWSRRLKECTLQDILAMTLSYLWPITCLGITSAFVSNPSMKFLLYAALPNNHQTWITFGLLLFEELRSHIVICAMGAPTLTTKVIFFKLVRNKLEQLLDSMQRNISKSLRHVQLYVGIANSLNCYIIFSWKMLCIGVSIGAGYAAVAHFSAYPVFGVMYYLIFLNGALVYIVCYDKAFKIPSLFWEVTRRAMLATQGGNAEASKVFKRQIGSVPRVGIKVGEFHLMEREASMNFIDFVLKNIVSLLVAYG